MDDIPPRRFGRLRWLTGNTRVALLRAALIIGGLSLFAFSATFLLAVDWDGTPASSAADELTAVGAGGTAVGAGDTAFGSPNAGVGVRSESGVPIGVGEAARVAWG